jgi:homoserine O-acetyltransferase
MRDMLIPFCDDARKKPKTSSTQAFRHSGIQAFRHSGIQAFRHSGIQAFKKRQSNVMTILMNMRPRALLVAATVLAGIIAIQIDAAFAAYPAPQEGTWIARDVRFATGEMLPEVRLHYRTIGTPHRDAAGVVRNAILILHGTGASSAQFLQPQFADEMFGPGQPLDATRYFLILPDGIGHGQSSKPSDGARMAFPRYTYDDMVRLQYALVTEGLQVNHLRLVLGASMGGMQAWLWGYMYPTFMDALVALASAPAAIVGRSYVWRKMMMDAIREDPAWHDGNYTEQPRLGLSGALRLLLLVGSVPLQWQTTLAATRDQADAYVAEQMARRLKTTDANDTLYQIDASRDYDPAPHLEQIAAPLLAINSADDPINPPELGLVERLIPRVKRGRFILIPISDRTRGHATYNWPAVWRADLEQFLASIGDSSSQ